MYATLYVGEQLERIADGIEYIVEQEKKLDRLEEGDILCGDPNAYDPSAEGCVKSQSHSGVHQDNLGRTWTSTVIP